jgi:hypothetical protein
MTPFVSTVVAYGVIAVLLWGYGAYLFAAYAAARSRHAAQQNQNKGE